MESEMPAEVDQAMMDVALAEARAGLAVGGVPVGAALATGGRLIASGTTSGSSRATRSPTVRCPACAMPGGSPPTVT